MLLTKLLKNMWSNFSIGISFDAVPSVYFLYKQYCISFYVLLFLKLFLVFVAYDSN